MMQVPQFLRFQNLSWNPKQNSFKISDSTDRRIASFLYGPLMQAFDFTREIYMPTYPWSAEGFSHCKPQFLETFEMVKFD